MTTISYPYQKVPVIPQVIAALFSGFVLFLALTLAWTLGFQLLYAGRIFPGVSEGNKYASGTLRRSTG